MATQTELPIWLILLSLFILAHSSIPQDQEMYQRAVRILESSNPPCLRFLEVNINSQQTLRDLLQVVQIMIVILLLARKGSTASV